MFRLEHGRSYIWALPIFVVIFFGVAAVCASHGIRAWGFFTLAVFGVVLLSSELRSRVALDGWWRATHAKGTWQYRSSITWHAVWTIAAYLMCLVVSAG